MANASSLLLDARSDKGAKEGPGDVGAAGAGAEGKGYKGYIVGDIYSLYLRPTDTAAPLSESPPGIASSSQGQSSKASPIECSPNSMVHPSNEKSSASQSGECADQ